MHENTGKNILRPGIDNMMISLIPSKIKVVVIGGGEAGLIKSKTFSNRGCNVTVVSIDFRDGFKDLERERSTQLVYDHYKMEYILDKHLVVVATNDDGLNKKIIMDCESTNKLYLNCSDYRQGTFGVPYQSETNEFYFSIQTKRVNPRLAIYVGGKIKNVLEKYDDFSEFLSKIRKEEFLVNIRKDIMKFMCTDDFLFFFRKGKGDMILKMFYGGKHIEIKDSDTEKQTGTNAD